MQGFEGWFNNSVVSIKRQKAKQAPEQGIFTHINFTVLLLLQS